MAFTATINSITPQSDGTGVSVNYLVTVAFADSGTSFSSTKTYTFPLNTTQAAAVSAITADGTSLKSALATVGTLQTKVGTVITI